MSNERKVMRWTSAQIYAAPDVGGFVAYGDYLTLESEVAALRAEVDALRLFGNKDCTAQADEYLAARAYLGMDAARKESSK